MKKNIGMRYYKLLHSFLKKPTIPEIDSNFELKKAIFNYFESGVGLENIQESLDEVTWINFEVFANKEEFEDYHDIDMEIACCQFLIVLESSDGVVAVYNNHNVSRFLNPYFNLQYPKGIQ